MLGSVGWFQAAEMGGEDQWLKGVVLGCSVFVYENMGG